MKYNKLAIACLGLILAAPFSCTTKEKLNSTLTEEQAKDVANISALLTTAYRDLDFYAATSGGVFQLQEVTSDECIVPTRASDWDDNGALRVLFAHTWTAEHSTITGTFNALLKAVFDATNILNFNVTPQQGAEAKFIRAFAMYTVLDLYGQVPVREPGENLLNAPKVLGAAEAATTIITELESIIGDLPDGTPQNAGQANKNAARVLLMKLYLNKATYGPNRANPVFDDADMQKVITLADQITGYSLAVNYFDNYMFNNSDISTENIFVRAFSEGVPAIGDGVQSTWMKTLHYNQNPGGWNGYATLADVYNKFEDSDKRRTDSIIGSSNIHGVKAGFLRGQQYNEKGQKLLDKKNNLLTFLDEVNLQETDPNTLERSGIRVIRYPVSYDKNGNYITNPATDYIFFRYADVLLMKAEALLRMSTPDVNGARTLVNQVRTPRGASALATITLDELLDERQREFYWDGWRRQDLIRFGAFLEPWDLKPNDDPKNLWFPVPASALAVNPNLTQNSGY